MTRWRPRLWMLLALVALVALVGAVGGLSLVRFYDDALVRQTEAELLSQAVVLAQAYEAALSERVPDPNYGVPRVVPANRTDTGLEPIALTLRATNTVLPATALEPTRGVAEPNAAEVGHALEPLLLSVSRRTLAGLRICDFNGVVVATSHPAMASAALGSREEFQRALRGAPVSALRARERDPSDSAWESMSRDNAVRVVVALPVTRGDRVVAVVMAVRTPMTLAKAVWGDRVLLGSTLLVLLLVLGLVSLGLAAFVVRPLRGLVKQTRAIAAGDAPGSQQLRSPVVAELAELSASLESMAKLLDERAAYVRHFTASLSHEFKTPLASIRGAVELLGDDFERLAPAQRQRLLANVQRDAERLTRLVQQVLSLARADMQTPKAEPLDWAPLVESWAQRWRAGGQQIDLSLTERPAVRVPAEVLEAVLGHLVENAQLHGQGAPVRLVSGVDAQGVWLSVRDEGPGVSAANQARIFEPFFTTAREHGGTGLGLSIAAALLKAFGGALALEPHEGRGAWFRLTLLQG